jgi:hypothetical protein
MFNKVTSRSYGYFLKFSYFFWLRNGFFQVGQKLQKLVKKTEGILGVKLRFEVDHSITVHCGVLGERERKSRTKKGELLDCTIHGFFETLHILHHFWVFLAPWTISKALDCILVVGIGFFGDPCRGFSRFLWIIGVDQGICTGFQGI